MILPTPTISEVSSKNHVLFFYFFTFLLSVILNKEHLNMQKAANSKETSKLHFPSPNNHLSSCAQPAASASFMKTFISLVAPGLICSTQHLPSLMQYVRSFSCGMWILSYGMWDLVPWPGTEPRPLALGVLSLSHWTTKEAPSQASWKRRLSLPFPLVPSHLALVHKSLASVPPNPLEFLSKDVAHPADTFQ